ncbi:MAG TPA: hypothetical protein VK444_04030 [Methanobacteriaceae archaeon]|nr:hypothetical protein [Methanobacteriaceae archaeon]
MKSFEDELTEYPLRNFRKVLHEPIGPYVVQGYNTILHLVQGFVLAALFYVLTIQPITPIILCNLLICVGIVVSLWYNIVTNSQYGSGIRASVFNTIFPVIIGIFQVALAFAISLPIYIFTLLLIPLFIVTMLHSRDHIIKHKHPQALEIWKEHFQELGSQFAQDIFDEFTTFEKDQLNKVLYLTVSLAILTLFNYFFPLNLEIKTYISFVIVGIFIISSVYFDLNRFFNNSEKLKGYGYKW